MNVEIIAEIGVNHQGDIQKALDLIYVAKESGAQTAKFQIFNPDLVVTKSTPLAEYQKKTNFKSQYDMLKSLALMPSDFEIIKKYCEEIGINFLASVFDSESFDFAIHNLKVSRIKVASGEISNVKLLYACGKYNLDVILSTGASHLGEIEFALSILSLGYQNLAIPKSRESIIDILSSGTTTKILKRKVSLLHCVTDYPANSTDLNLNAIKILKHAFGLRVGYSDHSLSSIAAIVAVAFGAQIIEKHLTLDQNLEGPDHLASLSPGQLYELVKQLQSVESMIEKKLKVAQLNEVANRAIVRRKIIATRNIKKNEEFSLDSLDSIRSSEGICASNIPYLLGKKSKKDYIVGEVITELYENNYE